MDFSQSDTERLIQEQTAAFVARHCPRDKVRKWDEDGVFPEELYQEMARAGYVGMFVPEAYGGTGNPMAECILVLQEFGRMSVDLPTRLALQAWGAAILANSGSKEQCESILPRVVRGETKLSFSLTEPETGSDAAGLKTRARRDGDDWVLNGQKVYSTGAKAKDNVMILAARTDPEAKKREGISLFLVPSDAPGVTVTRMKTVGRHIIGTNEVFLSDVRVPADAVVGGVNKGWAAITAHLERERIMLAANYMGCALCALGDAITYAGERNQFGRPIRDFQAIKHMLSEMTTEVEAGRWLTQNAAWRYDQGFPCATEASMAKLFVSEMLARVTTQGMQILGGAAYTYDHDMQRHWRDARNGTVGGGTSQIQKELIGRDLDRWAS